MSDLLINLIFVIATGFIAFHGITYRDEEGKRFNILIERLHTPTYVGFLHSL